MRKFFLIPLLTLVCSVMAWAGKIDYKALPMPNPDGAVIETPAPAKAHKAVKESEDPVNEAKIGETEYATLFEAFIAAENNDVIELLADVNPSTWYAGELDNTSVTIKGNGHIIRKTPIFVNETDDPMVITFDGVTVNAASWFAYAIGDVTIVLADGTTNTLTSAKKYGFCGQGAGDLKITGNGELSATADYMFYQMHSVVLEAGTYNINPLEYVDLEHFLVTKVSSNYKVSTPAADVVAYNLAHLTTYTSLADAVEAAQVREIITLYADATSISVDKHIGFNANGFNASAISAAAGYQKVIEDDLIVFNSTAADSFAEFLASEGTAAYELSDDIDISLAGTLPVNGTKTLTIPESKKILYARQMTGSNIIVNENAKLTILGSGTFQPAGGTSIETSTNEAEQVGRHIIDVYGELVVGVKNDPNNQPHFITTSLVRGSEAVYVRKGAQATFNNAHMQLGCVSIQNYGTTVIEGGEYISVSSASNGINNASWWSYNLQNYGKMTINGGHVQGVHGALACQNAYSRDQIENNGFEDVSYAVINGGLFETVHGTNFATGKANAKDNYRALYISNYAVVDIHGGEFKVQLPSACGEMAQIGNNDAYNTYGIVNLYGGKFQQKIKVAAKKNGESSYPASIPVNSAWYSSFKDEVPIPAGYELYDITEGEDYEAGYRYGVRPVAGKAADGIDADAQAAQEADPTYTIPWQVSTTWASDVVPEATTIVTIPVGATVTVQNGAGSTNDAVADQVFVAQGATLKVEDGTTLTIGEGGLNIGTGGQLVVEEGAIVTVGDAGIITQDDPSTLVVSATETGSGALLISPAVTENTHPYATVEMYAKAHKDGDTWYAQHFGIPTYNTPEIGWAPGNTWVHKFGENGWENITSLSELQPFVGYKLTNNSAVAAGKYTFTGNIIGNGDATISFVKPYYNLLANSYTAPMSLAALFTDIENQYGNDVDLTVWIYKSDEDRHVSVTKAAVLSGEDPEAITTIAPMQGFILYCGPTQPVDGVVNYEQAIWNNTDKTGVPIMAPARDAQDESVHATIVVTSEKSKDEVVLRENNEYSNAFDNGADARKYMSERVFDFYSVNNGEAFSQVATDDLAGTELTMKAKDETVYTMSFRNVNNFDYEIRDNLSGAIIPVVEGTTYEFTMAEGTTAEARFEVIGIAKIPTAIENVDAVKAAKGIYTVLGQYLGESSILNTLPNGIYVVDGQRIVK